MDKVLKLNFWPIFCLLILTLAVCIPYTWASGLANSPWPCRGHDARHTGRSPYVGAQTPTLKWSYQTGGEVSSSPAIGVNGTIYVGSSDKKLYALDPNGNLNWYYTTYGAIKSSPAIKADGTIYFGSRDGALYALNSDGTLKWSYQTLDRFESLTRGGIVSSPVIGTDGTIYFGSTEGKLYALNSEDGKYKWNYSCGSSFSSPAIGTDGKIYIGGGNAVFAFDPNGNLEWSHGTGDPILASSPSIGNDGTIYISCDTDVWAFYPDGSLKFRYQTWNVFTSFVELPAIGFDGAIYIGLSVIEDAGKFYALNSDGTLKWSCQTLRGSQSSPAIGADGTIYFAAGHNKFYALDPNGNLKWNYAPFLTPSSSPVIGADGTLYVGSSDGKIYAFTTIEDVDPPEIICPPDMVVSATDRLTMVNYEVTVTDNIDPNPVISYNPSPGTGFALGETTVVVKAMDKAGNSNECTFTVTVEDNTPPVITCPSDITISTTDKSKTVSYGKAIVFDNIDPSPLLIYNPVSGSIFSQGTTEVKVTATDSSGNSDTCTFTVSVGGPEITCPNDIVISATSSLAGVTYQAEVKDDLDPDPLVIYEPPQGTIFPVGITEVKVTATNSYNISSTCTFNVTVVDADLKENDNSSSGGCFLLLLRGK